MPESGRRGFLLAMHMGAGDLAPKPRWCGWFGGEKLGFLLEKLSQLVLLGAT